MRIARPATSPEHTQLLQADIARAAEARGVEGRICGMHCSDACRSCGSSRCQCNCSPHCPDAPRALSNDPAFPLEPGITPLAFELKRTGLFEPCWSCEGHASADGAMQKPPTVWFYCDAMTPLRVLSAGLAKLRLSASWRISLTYSDPDNPEPTFALEPTLGEPKPTLAQLQADIAQIARALPDMLRNEARSLQNATRSR